MHPKFFYLNSSSHKSWIKNWTNNTFHWKSCLNNYNFGGFLVHKSFVHNPDITLQGRMSSPQFGDQPSSASPQFVDVKFTSPPFSGQTCGKTEPTWRIIPVSKALVKWVTSHFLTGLSLLRGLTTHGYKLLPNWDDPPSSWWCWNTNPCEKIYAQVFFWSEFPQRGKNQLCFETTT